MTLKEKLRLHFRELRKSLTDDQYLRGCDAITARVRSLPEFAHARTVHSYWPSLENREVDTRPLIEELAGRGTAVVLPVVETFGSTLGTPRLSHVLARLGNGCGLLCSHSQGPAQGYLYF